MVVLLPVAAAHSFLAIDAAALHYSSQSTLAISAVDVFH
jgi:hypothetical protein